MLELESGNCSILVDSRIQSGPRDARFRVARRDEETYSVESGRHDQVFLVLLTRLTALHAPALAAAAGCYGTQVP